MDPDERQGMSLYYKDEHAALHLGDAREQISAFPDESVDCIVTSPPYFGLRDYGAEGQYGQEGDPREYADKLVRLFRECHRVLAKDGTFWLNLGDTYSGYHGNKRVPDHEAPSNKPGYWENMRQSLPGGIPAKNMIGIPWRVALALQDDGWILRNNIIWARPSPAPFKGLDRLSSSHEHIFMFSKSARYWFDLDPIRAGESRRNPGDVWTIGTSKFRGAHFATFPPEVPERCISAGCKPGGVVLDPFSGTATTGMAALKLGRKYVGVDINPDYHDLALSTRLSGGTLDFGAA